MSGSSPSGAVSNGAVSNGAVSNGAVSSTIATGTDAAGNGTRAIGPPRIAASLWSVPRDRWDDEAHRLADAGLEFWHWDHSDGTIGPVGGFEPHEAARLTATSGCRAEAHLMALDPRPLIDLWTPFCELVVVHAESPFVAEAVASIRARGARAAIAVAADGREGDDALETGADDLLVMSVAPGHAGASFQEAALDRIAQAVAPSVRLDGSPRVGDPSRLIGIDGSVTPERARRARVAGASWFVSGTSLVSAPDATRWLREVGASS